MNDSKIHHNEFTIHPTLWKKLINDTSVTRSYEMLHYNNDYANATEENIEDHLSVDKSFNSHKQYLQGNNLENNHGKQSCVPFKTKVNTTDVVADSYNLTNHIHRLSQSEAMALHHVPWILRNTIEDDLKNSNQDTPHTDNNEDTTGSTLPKLNHKFNNSFGHTFYPSWDYLSIRQIQNTNWAEKRLEKGLEYARYASQSSNSNNNNNNNMTSSNDIPELAVITDARKKLVKRAESCYKEGLEMIPNHVGLLTAYGILCANDKDRLPFARKLLLKAISVSEPDSRKYINDNSHSYPSSGTSTDSHVQNARKYLYFVEERMKGNNNIHFSNDKMIDKSLFPDGNNLLPKKTIVTQMSRAEKAIQDALTEKSLMEMESDGRKDDHNHKLQDYKLIPSSSSSSPESLSSASKQKHKRKHKHHHHHKRKRRRRDRSNDDNESVSSLDDHGRRHRKHRHHHRHRHKKRRKGDSKSKKKHHKHRRRRQRSDDSDTTATSGRFSNLSADNEDSIIDERRKSKHQRHKRKKTRKSSKRSSKSHKRSESDSSRNDSINSL